MPSVLFLFHRCIHCLGEFLVQGFDHSEASVAFRIGSAFRATVTDTVSGEFGYASVQGPVRAKRYGNQLEFAQSDKNPRWRCIPQRGICSLPTVTVRAAALLSGVPARCHIPAVHKAFRYLQEIRTRRKRRGLRR